MSKTAEIKSTVKSYIETRTHASGFSDDVNLFDAGVVSSLFAIELMTFLEKTYSVKIGMADLDMANFRSLNAVAEFLERKGVV